MIESVKMSKRYLIVTAFMGILSASAMDITEVNSMKTDSSRWYGGAQGESYFAEKSSEIIEESVVKIRAFVKSVDGDGEKVAAYYEPHLKSNGQARNEIAVKTNTEDAPDFGLPRMGLGQTLFTPLSMTPQYAKWYECYLEQLTSRLMSMSRQNVLAAKIRDKESYTIITVKPFSEILYDKNYETEIEGFKLTPRQMGMAQILNEAATEGRLFFVKSQTKILCEGQWVPSVSYITTLYVDSMGDKPLNEKSIKTVQKCGILAIHAKEIHIPLLLRKTARIWKDAILCDVSTDEDLSQFKSLLVDFRYMASQLTFFKRGSASIAEWDQKILLKIQELMESYLNGWTRLSVDLNALTHSYGEFKTRFEANVKLDRLERK